ncbi:MAG: aminoacyl-tRNA hydrolase [Patescibacteria group bacterium]|nr:aminoacyl-tRNA hydrolase [Patescibacteria group bacterium]
MKIIVGLGNPGDKYQKTRHNVGWLALDLIATKYNLKWREEKKWQALVAEFNGDLLVKPLTFMNLSGESLAKIMNYYKLIDASAKPDYSQTLIVIHDDLDLDLGRFKVTADSSSAGHNGIKSIINLLKTQQFTRYRIGVKTEALGKIRLGIFKTTPAKFVLAKFSNNELAILNEVLNKIVNELETID